MNDSIFDNELKLQVLQDICMSKVETVISVTN